MRCYGGSEEMGGLCGGCEGMKEVWGGSEGLGGLCEVLWGL